MAQPQSVFVLTSALLCLFASALLQDPGAHQDPPLLSLAKTGGEVQAAAQTKVQAKAHEALGSSIVAQALAGGSNGWKKFYSTYKEFDRDRMAERRKVLAAERAEREAERKEREQLEAAWKASVDEELRLAPEKARREELRLAEERQHQEEEALRAMQAVKKNDEEEEQFVRGSTIDGLAQKYKAMAKAESEASQEALRKSLAAADGPDATPEQFLAKLSLEKK